MTTKKTQSREVEIPREAMEILLNSINEVNTAQAQVNTMRKASEELFKQTKILNGIPLDAEVQIDAEKSMLIFK